MTSSPVFTAPPSVAPPGRAIFEPFRRRVRTLYLPRLLAAKTELYSKLDEVPNRMQVLTNQVRLLLELAHDYEQGRYRKLPWYSLAAAILALLYFISPADLLPDYIPVLGALDDLFALGLAVRVLRKDLIAYCEFKGLDPDDYFSTGTPGTSGLNWSGSGGRPSTRNPTPNSA